MYYSKFRTFACDFETTVYEGQTSTEVWSACLCELNTEDVKILHSMDEFFAYIESLKCNVVGYFHNLKFDGSFILDYLIFDRKLQHALTQIGDNEDEVCWVENKEMLNNTFKYGISDRGQWYTITIKIHNIFIEFRDSLKLLPFTLRQIGDAFNLKHRKLEMEYKGYRYAGCYISPEEEAYIMNDVLVLKEALEFMFSQGHKSLTIGSCCLTEFKHLINHGNHEYECLFPDLYEVKIDEAVYGRPNAGEYIRRSYKGGWCYLVKGKEGVHYNGVTADVNSLYPSEMSSESGNYYPIGKPTFWSGDIPEEALRNGRYYFVRVRTAFHIKENHLPFVQIKGNPLYIGTECLESSDIINRKTGEVYTELTNFEGKKITNVVELTLTMTDWELLKDHYNLTQTTILDGCYFNSQIGIFDSYIDKYRKIKMESKGAMRTLAKLFLNNLYGKMASSTDSSFKIAVAKDDGVLSFLPVEEHNKKAGYIAIGSAITSYARNFTIRTAQKNYHGVDKAGFIYADTDSIHCDIPAEELVGVPTHPSAFCHWKLESSWDVGYFVRQKTYIEHVTHEDLEPIDKPYYNLKCAGLPDKCKNLFLHSVLQDLTKEELDKLSEEERKFVSIKRELSDFDVGLKVPSKLMPKRIKGGIILVDSYFEMR